MTSQIKGEVLVVNKSAVLNHPQLIGDHDGSMFVKFHDWSSIFEYTTTIKGIKSIPTLSNIQQ